MQHLKAEAQNTLKERFVSLWIAGLESAAKGQNSDYGQATERRERRCVITDQSGTHERDRESPAWLPEGGIWERP